MDEKEKNIYAKDRETLHKQFELLAERSKNIFLDPTELVALTEQMIAIHRVLYM